MNAPRHQALSWPCSTAKLFSLHGKIAVVTGGYGHLGRAMCEALALAGAKVYAAGPHREGFEAAFPAEYLESLQHLQEQGHTGQQDHLENIRESIRENIRESIRENICFRTLDLSCPESVAGFVAGLEALDILVNNAFFLSSAEQPNFSKDMHAALGATVELTELCLPLLKGGGRIINIASMYGSVAPDPQLYEGYGQYRSRASYGAAKAGLLQLTRYWASFWADCGIRVNSISPGAFPRPNIQQEAEPFVQRLAQRSLLSRIGKPEDLAGALLLLASDAGAYITGADILVDGGWAVQ